MTDKEQKKAVLPADERLPATLRAELLAGETSVFFNVALFEHCQRVADMFSKSTMVPETFRGNTGNCMIALNYASRIKADPFMTMQTMYVIHGKPAVEGKLVKALIEQSDKYKDLDFAWLDAKDNPIAAAGVYNNSQKDGRGCRLVGTDTKTEGKVQGPKISWKIVHEEGWFGKQGSKWKTMPELMFMYRASSWFANIHCPEVKLGMMTVEEVKDIVDLTQAINGTWKKQSLTDKIAGAAAAKDAPEDGKEAGEGTNGDKACVCSLYLDGKPCGFKAASRRGLKKHITQQHQPGDENPPKEEEIVEDAAAGPGQPDWNKNKNCPNMDSNPIPVARCNNPKGDGKPCPDRNGCPEWAKKDAKTDPPF